MPNIAAKFFYPSFIAKSVLDNLNQNWQSQISVPATPVFYGSTNPDNSLNYSDVTVCDYASSYIGATPGFPMQYPTPICDSDLTTFFQTIGKASDSLDANLTINLQYPRNFTNGYIFLNSNIASITIYTGNDPANITTQVYTDSGVTIADRKISLGNLGNIQYFRVVAHSTITANQEKQINELKLTSSVIDPVTSLDASQLSFSSIDAPNLEVQNIILRNIRGDSIKVTKFARHRVFNFDATCKNLTNDNTNSFRSYNTYDVIKQEFSKGPLLVYLYYSDIIIPFNIGAIYLMNDESQQELPMSSNTFISGVDGKFSFRVVA